MKSKMELDYRNRSMWNSIALVRTNEQSYWVDIEIGIGTMCFCVCFLCCVFKRKYPKFIHKNVHAECTKNQLEIGFYIFIQTFVTLNECCKHCKHILPLGYMTNARCLCVFLRNPKLFYVWPSTSPIKWSLVSFSSVADGWFASATQKGSQATQICYTSTQHIVH